MIINNVIIGNFKSYFGQNNFEFTEGLNLISGHEGSGKTNFFDALTWLLYGNSNSNEEDEFIVVNAKIRNTYFLEQIEESIETFVEMNITLPESYRNDYEKKIKIRRCIKIALKADSKSTSYFNASWRVIKEELTASTTDSNYNIEIYRGDNATTVLNQIFPPKLRPYMWFQGEQLNKLIDFENDQSLKDAVDYISYLNVYNDMDETITSINSILNKKERLFIQRNTREKNKYKKESQEIDYLEKRIIENENEIKFYLKKISEKEMAFEEAKKKLVKLAGFPKLLNRKDQIENEIKTTFSDIQSRKSQIRYDFVYNWMFKDVSPFLKEASSKIDAFKVWRRNQIVTNNNQYEDGVPGDNLIKEMLEAEHCKICNTPAPKKSPQYKAIESHLDENKKLNLLSPEIESINENANRIDRLPRILSRKFENIDQKIKISLESYKALNEKKGYLIEQRKEVEKGIQDFADKHGGIPNENPDILDSTINRLNDDLRDFRNNLEKLKAKVLSDKGELKSRQQNIRKLNLTNEEHPASILTEYTEFISHKMGDLKEKEKNELFNRIEEKANEIQRMVADVNNIVLVIIKINRNTNALRFLDSDGNPTETHEAQKTMAKLSLLSAIINISGEVKNDHFPFIADAPMSDFGQDFSNRFLNTVSKVYKQCIILSKDVVHEVERLKEKSEYKRIIQILKSETNETKAKMTNSVTAVKILK